jgi:hypothetical protein
MRLVPRDGEAPSCSHLRQSPVFVHQLDAFLGCHASPYKIIYNDGKMVLANIVFENAKTKKIGAWLDM